LARALWNIGAFPEASHSAQGELVMAQVVGTEALTRALVEAVSAEQLPIVKRTADWPSSSPKPKLAGASVVQEGQSSQPPEGSTSHAHTRIRNRKPKTIQGDMFKDFGKAHGSTVMLHDVDASGHLVRKFNYKRFWQSEQDLHRWQQSLNDHSRFD
jgi:hypothetical protein